MRSWLSQLQTASLMRNVRKIQTDFEPKYNEAASGWDMFMFLEHLIMPDPAFLVDGIMEQRILQHICPGKPVQRLNCNGKNVALEIIVDRIEFHIRLLNNRYDPIIILIDREQRRATCVDIVSSMNQLLDERRYSGQFVVAW